MKLRALAVLSLCTVLCSCSARSDTGAVISSETSVSSVLSETASSVGETTGSETVTETSAETSASSETPSEAVSEKESHTDTSEESTYTDTADRITEVTLSSEDIVIETTFSRAAPEDHTGSFYMYLENYSADPEFRSFYIECLNSDAPVNAVREFTVERLENGEWVNVPLFVPEVFLENSFLGIIIGKEPPALQFSISDIDFAEPLESGHYRITVIDTNGVFNGETVSCEFDVP